VRRILQLTTFAFVLIVAARALAQTPNTAALIVTVEDPNHAVIPGATVKLTNEATGEVRNGSTDANGTVRFSSLPLNGTYRIIASAANFRNESLAKIDLRAGETATLIVSLQIENDSIPSVTVYGTQERVRTDPQIGRAIDTKQINETPALGRKVAALPLLNSAFRPGKGTGDLFVNTIYVATGAGGRREVTTAVDGSTVDEPWGRQTSVVTIPMGAVQEMQILTNAFSSEYGWTAGPAVNVITKSGTNVLHGEVIFLGRPGGWQDRRFSTKNFCPPSITSCTVPTTLTAMSAPDIPDRLNQFSFSIGGPIKKDKTFFFVSNDFTRQCRTAPLSPTLPSFVLDTNGDLFFTGKYQQELLDLRIDHRIDAKHSLTLRGNLDRFYDTNPQDTVSGTSAPTVARSYQRDGRSLQLNHDWIVDTDLVNQARFTFLNGDPVTKWTPATLSTTYTRSGSAPFTIGQSRVADLFSRQAQVSDTLTWTRGINNFRFGGSVARHNSGGNGSEFGTAALGTFTFKSTTTAPFSQLALNDVQNYTQPINFGISTYNLTQWLYSAYMQDDIRLRPSLTVNLGVRYDRQSITTAKNNLAPRIGFGWNPGGDARTAIRGGYGMYYTQIRSNVYAAALTGGLDGLASYTAVAGQTGFPTCLTCVPVNVDPKAVPAAQLPARDITILPGQKAFYEAQFARYGLNFDLLPNYPDKLKNPRSQVMSIGVEREFVKGFFVGTDFVHQHWTGIDRAIDLNAPSAFDRTAPGQTRSVTVANATRPILPVNGGVRQVNVLMNLGKADYNGLQTQVTYRGRKLFASLSYTLSKATNTTEPDGNGINPNQSIITRLGEDERGLSILDQRHRAVLSTTYQLPWNFTVGSVTYLGSARPINATTGIDNNGDGLNNDRPVINGVVVAKSFFRSTATHDITAFVENAIRLSERARLTLRLEAFNLTNNPNVLGRAQTVYGDTGAANPTFGQLATVANGATIALPALANIDTPRMFQVQARFSF
jgi:outer membrane receptor protein involved in Fe transport